MNETQFKGKAACKILRQIRQQIAEENDIPLVTQECTYQGNCKGTCPKCEAELRYLEEQLARRQKLDRCVAAVGFLVTLLVVAGAILVITTLLFGDYFIEQALDSIMCTFPIG